MKTSDIILIPFPFAELTNKKVRPSVVIAQTKDKYRDILVAAISSVVPEKITGNEIIIESSAINKLRSKSVIKVYRIVTVKKEDMIASLGKLTESELSVFKEKFKALVDENKPYKLSDTQISILEEEMASYAKNPDEASSWEGIKKGILKNK